MTSFFDTNVLLYILEPAGSKCDRAAGLVGAGGVISVQVLNEFVHVARRKLRMDLPEILESLAPIKDALEIVPLTLHIHTRAMEIALATNFDTYDCAIIAAAEISGCDVLYTEDMNHGQRIGAVVIRNPFVAA